MKDFLHGGGGKWTRFYFFSSQIGEYSFTVRWSGPSGAVEFDRYQVAIGIRRKTPQIIGKKIFFFSRIFFLLNTRNFTTIFFLSQQQRFRYILLKDDKEEE